MAIAVRYYITSNTGSYIDWSARYVGFALPTDEMLFVGAVGTDSLSIQAGASVNATNMGLGDDKIYLSGRLSDYTQSIDQDSGVYTFTRAVGTRTEVVKVLVSDANDVLYFADGHITINAAEDARLHDGAQYQQIQAQWLQSGGTPSGPVSTAPVAETDVAPIKAFVEDAQGAYIPALTQPGQALQVTGSSGVDTAYVGAGTVVDASQLGLGNDKIYLMGTLAEYSQSIDQETGIYTLTRTVDGKTESVKFLVGDEDDQVYFADGHITINAATDERLYDGVQFKPLQADWLVSGGSVTQTMADALAKIAAYADSSSNPVPTVTDYRDAGVTGVTADNLAAVNYRVDAVVKTAADELPEVQALVDAAAAAPIGVAVSPTGAALTGTAEPGATVTVKAADGTVLGTATAGADGKFSVALSPVQNDAQTVAVTAGNASGTSAPVTATAPDTTPAAAPSGVAVSADGTALTGTGEPGSTITVKAADGTVLGTAVAGSDGQFSVALSPVQNDGQSLSVTAADAGGASAPVIATAPDTTAPQAPVLAPGAGVANGATATEATQDSGVVTVNAEVGAATAVTFTNGNQTVTKKVIGTGSAQAIRLTPDDLAILGDGSINVSAIATDAAGNISPIGSTNITLDATAPVAPTLAATDGSPITGTAEAGSTVTIKDAAGNVIGTTTADANGNFSLTPATPVADGTTINATATDAAGNTSEPATTTVDATAPVAPTVALGTGVANGATAAEATQASGVVTVSAETGSTTTVTFTNGAKTVTKTVIGTGSAQAVQLTAADLTVLGDGPISVSATSTDAAGNTSGAGTGSFTLDTVAPTAPDLALGTGVANGATAAEATQASGVVTVSAETGSTTTVTFTNGAKTVTKTVTGTGAAQAVQLTAADLTALGDGPISVSATSTDAAGNTSSAGATSFTLDTVSPVTGTLSLVNFSDTGSSATDRISQDKSFDLSLTGNEAGSTVIYQSSTDTGTTWTTTTAAQTALTDGSYQYRAIVSDAAGNSAVTAAVSVKVDTVAPSAPILATVSSDGRQMTGTAEAGSTVSVKATNGTTLGTALADANGNFSITLPSAQADGTALALTATDTAGNTSASASVIKSAPTIVALDQNLVQVEGAGTYESPAVLQALADGRWIAVWSNNGLSDDTATMTMQARLMNADGSPASNQFQLSNTAVDGADGYDIPNFAITQLSGGNIVVSWVRSGVSAPQDQPIATIVKPDGTIVATDIKLVQVEGPGTFESPAVIKALADGRWIAVWSNNGLSDDNTNMQIQARLVNADGTFASNQFQVGTIAVEGTDGYDVPNFAVTQLAGGNIVVTWERSYANGAPRDQPIASIIKSDGTVLSSDIQLVQTEGPGTYESPAVIQALADGRWLAVWSNDGLGDAADMLIQARFMNADGTPAGNQFLLSTIAVDGTDGYDVPYFSVTQLAGGNIVVEWVRNNNSGAPYDQPIATIIKPDGTVVASNIQMVQNEGPGTYESPAVIQALADGRWIAVWSNDGLGDAADMLVQARVFNADGTAASNQFQVGSIAVDGSGYDVPNFAVTQLAGGNVVVTWERNNNSGEPYDQPIFSVIDVATFRSTPFAPKISFVGGSQANDGLGLSLNSAGDFNGDGYQDFIVSAPHNQYYEGAVNSADIYLIYGSAQGIPSLINIDQMTAAQGIHYTNTDSGYDGYTGTVVKGIGDLNGDGYGDVVIGGLLGRNYVLWGGANKASTLDLATLNAAATANGFMMNSGSGWFGDGMGSADLNHDGISDLILGDSTASSGVAYVVYGHTGTWTNMTGTDTGMTGATGSVTTFTGGTYFGDRLGVVGDVNGDGYVDFVVNAPAADGTGGTDSGVSTLIFGTATGYPTGVVNLGADTTTTPYGIKISGTSVYENLGDIAYDRGDNMNGDAYYSQALTVGSIGDFNGDGIGDFIIGSPGWGDTSSAGSAPGRAYVFYGHTGSWSNMSAGDVSTAGKGFILTASGIGTNSDFGFAMAGGGDYNGDGYADFLVTAVNADTNGMTDNGAVWLVFGKAGGYSGTVDVSTLVANGQALQWTGIASGVFMGTNVAMGDWNKDGYADVAIPQWEAMSNGATKAGSFKIYYGNAAGAKSPSGITPVALDLNGDGQIGYGHVVMDVNGDGQKELTAWTDAQDGVLVWDKLGDGVVHDSSQYAFSLYGGETDLQGLAAAFDSNQDGSFDARDALFTQFAVWRDANQNGVSDAGEVHSLLDLGITSLNLSSDGVVRAPAEGVLEFGQTSATLSDGSTRVVADAAFTAQALHTAVQNATDAQHVDLSQDTSANTLDLQLSDVLAVNQHMLVVTAGANDVVRLDTRAWSLTDVTTTVDDHTYALWSQAGAHVLIDTQATVQPML